MSAPGAAALAAVREQLKGGGGGAQKRLALAEASFRLAVLPGTDPDVAINLLREAVAYDPLHPKLFFHLGRLLHLDGDVFGALAEYRCALRLAPRSHRTYVHIGLALDDLPGPGRTLGTKIFAALAAADEATLATVTGELDKLLRPPSEEDKQRAARERKDSAEPKEQKETEEPNAAGTGDKSKWRGLWQILMMEALAQPKPQSKRVQQCLDHGKKLVEQTRGAQEYSIACLLSMLDSPAACRQAKTRLNDALLEPHRNAPAMKLVEAACLLGAAESADEFVDLAAAKWAAGEVPLELVCCLHYSWYGGRSQTDPVAAVSLLDRYPSQAQSSPVFRELKVAILDSHARAAWTVGQLDQAQILWQEATAADPYRVATAHNLALAATRAKALDKYEVAWERAGELRYLRAAAAGDLRVDLDDRLMLHQSFARQSRMRYLKDSSGSKPSEQELDAWLGDREAFPLWLRESALTHLNAQYRFHSPLHLLMVGKDCSDEDADYGRENLRRRWEMCFRGRQWAGKDVYLDLACGQAQRASELAKLPTERKRDAYFEGEQADALRLKTELIDHGFLIFSIMKVATRSATPARRLAGLEAASYLLSMPWRFLEPQCKLQGILEQDVDLVSVFLSYVSGLLLEKDPASRKQDLGRRLKILEDLIQSLPEAGELWLLKCRLLQDAGQNQQAYAAALEGLPLTAKMADRAEAKRLEDQFAICVSNAAMAEIPERLLSSARQNIEELMTEVRRVLSQFPRAGGFRLKIAELLIRLADQNPSRLAEAAKILEDGLDKMLTDDEVKEARDLLAQAGSRSKSIEDVTKVRAILENAARRARETMAALPAGGDQRTPSAVRQTSEALTQSISECEEASRIAAAAKLEAMAEQASSLAADLRKILEHLEKG